MMKMPRIDTIDQRTRCTHCGDSTAARQSQSQYNGGTTNQNAANARMDALEQKYDLLKEDISNCCTKIETHSGSGDTGNAEKPDLAAQPNPFTDELSIRWYLPFSDNSSYIIRIGTMDGKVVKEIPVNGFSSLTLPTTSWSPTIYYVSLINISKSQTVITKQVVLSR